MQNESVLEHTGPAHRPRGKSFNPNVLSRLVLYALAAVVCVAVTRPALADHAAAVNNVRDGNTHYFNGDYASAEADFTSGTTNDPSWPLPYNNRGLARFHQWDFAGAIQDFDYAKSLSNAYVSVYLNKGKCLAAQEDFTGARAEFQAGIALAPSNAALRYNLGWIQDEQGLFTDAISNYNTALSLQTSYWRALLARGVSYAKQGNMANAVADFYGVINGATTGDVLASVAAYNLQRLRGVPLEFASQVAADGFVEGLRFMRLERFYDALVQLSTAQTQDPRVPDIPHMRAWALLKLRDPESASVVLASAIALMRPLSVFSTGTGCDVFVDGIRRGTTPAQLHLFSSQFDISLRGSAGTQQVEWVGVIYTGGSAGGTNCVRLTPVAVTNYISFGPVADTDHDWLADNWETRWFGGLQYGPQSDETDKDGLVNLYEYWYSCDPTATDTDGDGVSDGSEVGIYNTDPALSNAFYYVNDGSTSNDVWCTAPGNDANDGRRPSAPKATVQAILSSYTLSAGSVVHIDTGHYYPTSDITVSAAHAGTRDVPVLFAASPYGVMFDRAETGEGSHVWHISGANYVGLRTVASAKYPALGQKWMQVRGGSAGVSVEGTGCRLSRLDVCGSGTYGIYLNGGNVGLDNCLIRDSGLIGVFITELGTGASVTNCTIFSTGYFGLAVSPGIADATLANSIVCAVASGSYGIFLNSAALRASDYNLLYAGPRASVGYVGGDLTTLAEWQAATGKDAHSIGGDPLFAAPASGDFHPQSTAGRYSDGVWTTDSVSSPCIDAGDPSCYCGNEPAPNGGMINIGAYGSTEQASKSADTDGDGLSDNIEALRLGTDPLRADTDGDGMTDGSELTAGTNPTNAFSVLSVTNPLLDPAVFVLQWPSVSNRIYGVDRATNLILFEVLATNLPATPPVNVHTDQVPGIDKAFYRINVEKP